MTDQAKGGWSRLKRWLRTPPATELVLRVVARPIHEDVRTTEQHAALLAVVPNGWDDASVPDYIDEPDYIERGYELRQVAEALSEAVQIQLRTRDDAVGHGWHVVVGIATDSADLGRLPTSALGGQIVVSHAVWRSVGRGLRAVYEWQRTPELSREDWEPIFDDRQSLLGAPFERMFAQEIAEWVNLRRREPISSPYRPDVKNDLYGLSLSGG